MSNSHKLYLGMYILEIKKKNQKETELVSVNDFLSNAYHDCKKPFTEGFAQAIIHTLETTYKNNKNDQGAIISGDPLFNENNHTFDIMINGGNTGIMQSIIDEDGSIEYISKDKIVGMQFYIRFWLPSGSKRAYVFIQSYGNLGIKGVIDSLINDVLDSVGYTYLRRNKSLIKTTTPERQKEFLEKSQIKFVTLTSNKNASTASLNSEQVEIKFKRIKGLENKTVNDKIFNRLLRQYNIDINPEEYKSKLTYEYDGEVKTTTLDMSKNINIIPNIVIPQECINKNNYPIIEKLTKFVDNEMNNIKS